FVLYGSFTDSSSYTVTAGSSSTTSTPSSPSSSKSDSTTDIGVTGITLDQGTLEMEVGDSATLTATVAPSSATDPAVTWSSNNTSVATVNSKGFVKAVGTGSATITASAGDYSYTCSVEVSEAEDSEGVTNLTLSTNSITLAIGSSQTMTADVTPSSYEGDVTWESGDTAIATIDENGTVTAVAKGKTTLKAQADTFNSYCMITVVGEDDDVAVSSVTLDKTSLSLKKGNTATLTATVLPTDATNTNVTWKSSKESVATVSNGTVTAVAAGSATITVTSVYDTTKSASCTVTVTEDSEEEEDSDVAVTSVTLNKTTLSLAKGNTATLTATIAPSNATNKNITWKSGNESVATVSNGTVTAVAAGTAVITVTSVSDTTKSASCTVTVTDTTTWESVRTEAVNTTVSATAGRFNDSSNTVEITFDSLENNTAEYTGKAITPLPTVTFNGVELKKNADYTVSYKSNKLPGTATVTVKGTGEFKNSKTATFTINKIDLSDCDIRANDVILKKEGKEVKTTLKVYSENGVLIPASNYIVTYENNTAAGTATATITAKANSKLLNSGSATADFEVLAAGTDKKYLISGAKVTGVTALSYTGEALEQSSVTVTDSGKTALKEGTDYDIDYKCNVNAGKATMIVTGTGDYHGVKYVTFTIKANKTLSDKITIELSDESTYHYTGYPIKPLPVVSYNDTVLTEGTDYKLSWSKNLNVTDAATLKVVLKGNISLTKTATFKIQAYDWSDITAGFGTDEINTATKKALPVFYYNGTMITLKKGKAYTPKHTFDKSSKAVSVTIKGAGPYKEQTEKTGYSYTYTGK
ncbi:MAG: Ig-like domain-containing protein, partial [Lachnospiraceae bacterium]|nr:Ig-like domain-containing protein [Lachnospiraceae bacterium]